METNIAEPPDQIAAPPPLIAAWRFPLRMDFTFSDQHFDDALEGAKFRQRHPYIRYPEFGGTKRPTGRSGIWIRELTLSDTPESYIRRCEESSRAPITAKELAEIVAAFPDELSGRKVFAFGEKYSVAGCDGYPYADTKEDDLRLQLWYFYREWPPRSITIARSLAERV